MRMHSTGTLLRMHRGRLIAVLSGACVATIVAAGCTSPVPASTPRLTSSPSPLPSSIQASSTPGSPSPSPPPELADTWGPLAVIPPQDGADQARVEGTLRITDDCVILVDLSGPALLLWPADRTTWNAEDRTITFENLDGTSVSVGDGESVVLGGGGGSSAESGVTPEAWLAGMTWVARPANGCPLDPYWGIGDVRR